MKNLKTFLFAALIISLGSCSKSPKSCFTVEVHSADGKWVQALTGTVGQRFYFNPMCSKNAFTGTTFDYGDGNTGLEEGHEYSKPGTYTVKCTVFAGDHGQKGSITDVSTQTVTVKEVRAEAGSDAAVTTDKN